MQDKYPTEKSKRILMFCDLRDSTDILLNFEQNIYRDDQLGETGSFTYKNFIMDVHEAIYKEFYLEHENTFFEIYGDGVLSIFPEDNTKFILENIHRLTNRMRIYNEANGVGILKPRIDIGFSLAIGDVSFVYFSLDERYHPIGRCVHEGARIESLSKFYDARVLISGQFLSYSEEYIKIDTRFSYRFIDHVILKGFREPITIFELLLDNDPRFEIKKNSIQAYSEAYAKYRNKEWGAAKELFKKIHSEYGLGIGLVMASRCEILSKNPPGNNWNGVWKMKDK